MTDFYDPSDPFGVQQYLTPEFPGAVSTAKWNFGQDLPYDINVMGKQGNSMQDYYQILTNPVVQWLNMVTTGQGALDTNSLLQGGTSDAVNGLVNSDDEFLQSIGQQIDQGAPAASIKLQLRTVPEIANDDQKLAIYDKAVDDAAKAQSDQKATGPLAQFQKLGLTNPLETYTGDNLPGDVALDPNMAAYTFNQNGSTGYEDQLRNYANNQTLLAQRLAQGASQASTMKPRPATPKPQQQPTGPQVPQPGTVAASFTGRPMAASDVYAQPGQTPSNPKGNGMLGGLLRRVAQNAMKGASTQAQRNASQAQNRQQWNQRLFSRNADDFRQGVNAIKAYELQKQGRTPAQDQAAVMLSWLRNQGYGG